MNERHILVCAEDEKMRRVLAIMLGASGYKVTDVETIEAGLELTRRHKFDLVLLDEGLPDDRSIEIVRTVKASCEAPVVVMATFVAGQDQARENQKYADDFIRKPFGISEILERIRANVDRRDQSSVGALN